jgi:hypothetical protein
MSDVQIEIFEALVDYMFAQTDEYQQSFDSIAKELGVPVEWVQIVGKEMELV